LHKDLFHRLDVLPSTVPLWRARPTDMALLVAPFLAHDNQALGQQVPGPWLRGSPLPRRLAGHGAHARTA